MADKMTAVCGFGLLDTISHLSSDFHQLSYMNYFYQLWPKFEHRFCRMNDNHDGRKNGHPLLPDCTCGHSNSVIYHPVSSKFHIWITFIKRSPKFEWFLCDNQNGCQNDRLLSVCTCGHSHLVFITRFLPNFIYELLLSNSCRSLNMGFV